METQNFEELYTIFEKPLYNYIFRMVREQQLAEDLTQEVFIKIYQNLEDFRGDSSLKTWIYRIATNTYLDYFRTVAHKKDKVTDYLSDNRDDESSFIEAEKVLTIDEQLVKSEINDCVHDYVNTLPEDYRAVIFLHDLQGLKNREIADILNCSLDTIKIRLHRARKKFRTVCASDCNLYRDASDTLCCEKKET